MSELLIESPSPEEKRAAAFKAEFAATDAELAAIAERSAEAKRTTRAAIALFQELASMPGVHVGRVNERTADGRFAVEDE